jgi:hypothetical protein
MPFVVTVVAAACALLTLASRAAVVLLFPPSTDVARVEELQVASATESESMLRRLRSWPERGSRAVASAVALRGSADSRISPIWFLLNGVREQPEHLHRFLNADTAVAARGWILPLPALGLLHPSTGQPVRALWLLYGFVVECVLCVCLVLLAHEVLEARAWRAVARHSVRRMQCEFLSDAGEDNWNVVHWIATKFHGWDDWRSTAVSMELVSAAAQPTEEVVPVPQWWASREHYTAPLLVGVLFSLNPFGLWGFRVLGEGNLALMLFSLGVLQAFRQRWPLAAALMGVLSMVSPALSAAGAALVWLLAARERVRAHWAILMLWCISTSLTLGCAFIIAPNATASLFRSDPTTRITASFLWYPSALAISESADFSRLTQLGTSALTMTVPVVHAMVRAFPTDGSLKSTDLVSRDTLLAVPVLWVLASPDATIPMASAASLFLLCDMRIVTQWSRLHWITLLLLATTWLCLPFAKAQWLESHGANPNYVFGQQLGASVALGMVAVSWLGAMNRFELALEAAETMIRVASVSGNKQ